MPKDLRRKAAAEKLRGSVLAYHDPAEPVGDWTEWSAWGDGDLSPAELRHKVWQEVIDLFEGDEASARDCQQR